MRGGVPGGVRKRWQLVLTIVDSVRGAANERSAPALSTAVKGRRELGPSCSPRLRHENSGRVRRPRTGIEARRQAAREGKELSEPGPFENEPRS